MGWAIQNGQYPFGRLIVRMERPSPVWIRSSQPCVDLGHTKLTLHSFGRLVVNMKNVYQPPAKCRPWLDATQGCIAWLNVEDTKRIFLESSGLVVTHSKMYGLLNAIWPGLLKGTSASTKSPPVQDWDSEPDSQIRGWRCLNIQIEPITRSERESAYLQGWWYLDI